jgi:hypothetical protein
MKKLILILTILLFASPVLAGIAYYCDCTVSNGTGGAGTFADPFESIRDANAGPAATWQEGDDLYFLEGSTCTVGAAGDHLDITWDGTSGDSATIGCYDGEGDFVCDVGDGYPIIDGTNTYPAAEQYVGLIDKQDDGHEYVTLQDLQVKNSNGDCVYLVDVENMTIDNVVISACDANTLAVTRGAGSTISNNTLSDSSNDSTCGAGSSLCGRTVLAISGSFDADAKGASYTVTGNKVFGGKEGIGLYKNVNNSTINENVIYDCDMGVYVGSGSTNNTVKHNLMYTTSSQDQAYMNGIQLGCEDEAGSTNYCAYIQGNECASGNKIFGNLIAGMRGDDDDENACIRIYNNCTDKGLYALTNNLFYNNTCVDTHNSATETGYEIKITCNGGSSRCWNGEDGVTAGEIAGNEVKNNIFWTKNDEGTGEVWDNDPYGFSWSHNWYDTDPGGGPGGANDNAIIGGSVPTATPSPDFNNLTAGAVTGQEFALVQGFAGLVGGDTTLGDAYDDGFDNNTDQIANTDFTASPIAVQLQDRDEDGATWSIGAWEWAEPPVGVPNNASMGGS